MNKKFNQGVCIYTKMSVHVLAQLLRWLRFEETGREEKASIKLSAGYILIH